MISWHRPGQKVACTSPVWFTHDEHGFACPSAGPKLGEVSTIANVVLVEQFDVIAFELAEYPDCPPFLAAEFNPVYPAVVEDLRKLCVPSPGRVKEDA